MLCQLLAIFQILKDTHFSCIKYDSEELYYEIVAIKHSGTNKIKKQLILDYYEGTNIDFIKPILKFNCNKIKDNIAVQGWPLSCSSKILDQYISPYNSTVVTKILQNGGVLSQTGNAL